MPDDQSTLGVDRPRLQMQPGAAALAASGGAHPALRPEILQTLHDAAMRLDPAAAQSAITRCLGRGVTPEDLAELAIPEVARAMGRSWISDDASFSDVTVCVARLQSMLRALGPAWCGDQRAKVSDPAILLAVPHGLDHTLGASVLAGQLRRGGFSVRLIIGASASDLRRRLQHSCYDALLLSVGSSGGLESARQIVEFLTRCKESTPPIILGGSVLSCSADLANRIGADLVTNDLDEVLEYCGLTDHYNAHIQIRRGLA